VKWVREGVNLDIAMLNTIIVALFKNPTIVNEVYKLYHGFIDNANSHADVYTYNALIRGSCVIDQFNKTFSFHEQMWFKGIISNVYTFEMLVDCLCKQGLVV